MDSGRGGTAEGKHQVVSLCEIISTEESGKWAFVSVTNEGGGKEEVCDKRRCRRRIGRVSRGEDVEWKNCGEGIARNYIFLILYIRY